MNPAAARKLLSIEPSVVLNASRRLREEHRRLSAKSSSGNPVHQKQGSRREARGERVGRGHPQGTGVYLADTGAGGVARGGAQRREGVAGPVTTTEGMETRPLLVFVSTEVAPWSKVGGLADVIAALPKALVRSGGFDGVMSVSPMYEAYEGVVDCGVEVALSDVVSGHVNNVGETEGEVEGEVEGGKDGERDGDHDDDRGDGTRAMLYSVEVEGVERVFVKHPLLDMHRVKPTQELNNEHPSFTYVDGEGGVYDCHKMDVRYDIMAWGALMAAVKLPLRDNSSGSDGGCGGVGEKRDVVFVLNDWPTALVLVRLRHLLQAPRGELTDVERSIVDGLASVKTVFCIHNLAYQGMFSAEAVARDLGLSAQRMAPLMPRVPWQEWDRPDSDLNIQSDDSVNFMRAALLMADSVLTVSPHYAVEIASENEEFNCGLGEILRHKSVQGIMNGIDTAEWDPETDELLPSDSRYNAYTVFRGKNSMKRRLQARLGLVVDDSAVLFVFIGRLTEQKGVDALLRAATRVLPKKAAPHPIVSDGHAGGTERSEAGIGAVTVDALEPLTSPPIQLAVLGTGDQWMEQAVSSLECNFPGNAAGICEFSEEMAHWMLAAADYCMIPSKFEPCGLIAQCAARYGAVPIMTATGGLKNLGDAGVGITVPRRETLPESVDDLVEAMHAAIDDHGSDVHCDQRAFGMKYDFSWDVHAREWQALLVGKEMTSSLCEQELKLLNL